MFRGLGGRPIQLHISRPLAEWRRATQISAVFKGEHALRRSLFRLNLLPYRHPACLIRLMTGGTRTAPVVVNTVLLNPIPDNKMLINRKNRGFTLVEIMIVVAIIALLAAIAVPGFLRARKRAQGTTIKNDLRLIDAAKDQYAIEFNKTNVTPARSGHLAVLQVEQPPGQFHEPARYLWWHLLHQRSEYASLDRSGLQRWIVGRLRRGVLLALPIICACAAKDCCYCARPSFGRALLGITQANAKDLEPVMGPNPSVSTRGRGGFTLVEIMIVVAIIALLAAISVPGFLRARKRAQGTIIAERSPLD